MKKRNMLFLISILISIIGCKDEKYQGSQVNTENNSQIFSQKNKIDKSISKTFILKNYTQKQQSITINNKNIFIKNILSPVILIHFFKSSSSASKGMIPSLSKLQKKYKHDLFILEVIMDKPEEDKIQILLKKHTMAYSFIAIGKENSAFAKTLCKGLHLSKEISLPLTLLYKEGNYYIHYEGATPIEMVDHDIQEIIK